MPSSTEQVAKEHPGCQDWSQFPPPTKVCFLISLCSNALMAGSCPADLHWSVFSHLTHNCTSALFGRRQLFSGTFCFRAGFLYLFPLWPAHLAASQVPFSRVAVSQAVSVPFPDGLRAHCKGVAVYAGDSPSLGRRKAACGMFHTASRLHKLLSKFGCWHRQSHAIGLCVWLYLCFWVAESNLNLISKI